MGISHQKEFWKGVMGGRNWGRLETEPAVFRVTWRARRGGIHEARDWEDTNVEFDIFRCPCWNPFSPGTRRFRVSSILTQRPRRGQSSPGGIKESCRDCLLLWDLKRISYTKCIWNEEERHVREKSIFSLFLPWNLKEEAEDWGLWDGCGDDAQH